MAGRIPEESHDHFLVWWFFSTFKEVGNSDSSRINPNYLITMDGMIMEVLLAFHRKLDSLPLKVNGWKMKFPFGARRIDYIVSGCNHLECLISQSSG